MGLFFKKIHQIQKKKRSFLCVGLDPRLELIPRHIRDRSDGVFEFLKGIVDGVEEFSCCFKPQIACFSAYGLEKTLVRIIQYIHDNYPETPVILDAKRNDIGPTSQMYAIEAFGRYGADAVTLNPYMGWESVQAFVSYRDKGIFILCRTSNPGADKIQNLRVMDDNSVYGDQREQKIESKHGQERVPGGQAERGQETGRSKHEQKGFREMGAGGEQKTLPLYQMVARKALNSWNPWGNVGLVVGATALSELKILRERFPRAWFLVPGIGSQGGDLSALLDMEFSQGCHFQGDGNPPPGGLIINCSRAILYAGRGDDFVKKAVQVAGEIQNKMRGFF